MIIPDDSFHTSKMGLFHNKDDLPSYDVATSQNPQAGSFVPQGTGGAKDVKVPQQPSVQPENPAGPSQMPRSNPLPPFMPPTTVYNYVNPTTHEHVVSLLPPDNPQMICLQEGRHVPETRFGLLGIIAAIFWFPLGIACCLLDQKTRCRRCGQVLDEGVCG